MYYETDKNDHGLRYNPLKACVVPRPSGGSHGRCRRRDEPRAVQFLQSPQLRPAVRPVLGRGSRSGRREEGHRRQRGSDGEFVYNMATWAQKDQMNETALIVDRAVDEMAATGLEPEPSRLVRPPRVKGSPVQFECRLHQIITLPGRKPSSDHHLVIGRVVAVHIDDRALTADGRDRRREAPADRAPRLQGLRQRAGDLRDGEADA